MSLLDFWTPSDMAAAQAKLASNADGTNLSVQSCANLDAGTKGSWSTFYQSLKGFTAQTPVLLFAFGSSEVETTGKRADELESYERELYAWQQKLSGPCKLTLPAFDPSLPASKLPQSLKYIAVISGFLGTAWVVSNIASTYRFSRATSAYRQTIRRSRRF